MFLFLGVTCCRSLYAVNNDVDRNKQNELIKKK